MATIEERVLELQKENAKHGREKMENRDRIFVTTEVLHSFFNDCDMETLNLTYVPIIQNGVFVLMREHYTAYIVFDCNMDANIEENVEIKMTYYAEYKSAKNQTLFVWLWDLIFHVPFVGTNYMDVLISSYTDARGLIYEAEHRGKKFIENYIQSALQTPAINDELLAFLQTMAWINYIQEHPEYKAQTQGEVHERTSARNATVSQKITGKQKEEKIHTIMLSAIKIESSSEKVMRVLKSKTPQRIASCWSVRGHMRHYKNGKTVYIKPYEKGTDKTQRVKKIYQVQKL